MIGNKLLLDTNIVIELFRGNQVIITLLDEQEKVYIPVAVLGELYLGAYRSVNVPKKLQEIKNFVENLLFYLLMLPQPINMLSLKPNS